MYEPSCPGSYCKSQAELSYSGSVLQYAVLSVSLYCDVQVRNGEKLIERWRKTDVGTRVLLIGHMTLLCT